MLPAFPFREPVTRSCWLSIRTPGSFTRHEARSPIFCGASISSSPTPPQRCRRASPVFTRRPAKRSKFALPAVARWTATMSVTSLRSCSALATFARVPKIGCFRRDCDAAIASRLDRYARSSNEPSIIRVLSRCVSKDRRHRSGRGFRSMAGRSSMRTFIRRSRCGTAGRRLPARHSPSSRRRRASCLTGKRLRRYANTALISQRLRTQRESRRQATTRSIDGCRSTNGTGYLQRQRTLSVAPRTMEGASLQSAQLSCARSSTAR